MKKVCLYLSVLFGILWSLSGCERVTPPMLPEGSTPEMQPLTVMTYNVYLGSSVDPVLSVENLLEVPTAVANVYNTVEASDFPGRARAIAASIKTYQPHLIGLQEIALIRRQSPGDRIAGWNCPGCRSGFGLSRNFDGRTRRRRLRLSRCCEGGKHRCRDADVHRNRDQ